MDLNLNQTAIVAAAIGATSGLAGVVIGSMLTLAREAWSGRRTRARHARYLAIRVVCILDKYVESCAAVVCDDGLDHDQRDEEGCLQPQVQTPPAPSFPADLDWKSIDHTLMYRLLSMPNEADSADGKISSVSEYVAFAPDYEEYFEERRYQYAGLGLTAFAVTQELRRRYGIPLQESHDWDPVERLTEEKRKVEEYRRKRNELSAASPMLLG